ncbi:MAG: NfeD family protein [Halobacteriales archaeon]
MAAAVADGLIVAMQLSVLDAAFYVFVIGLLLMMTGAFGEANLALVGIAVSLVGLAGMALGPYSTPLVLGALVPIVGFVLIYLYRYVEFPRTTSPKQTTAVEHLRGRVGRVTETATPHGGTIHLRGGGFDPNFRCRTRAGTIPAGERAVVVDPGGGNVLTVAPEGSVDPATLESADGEVGWAAIHRLRKAVHRRLRG